MWEWVREGMEPLTGIGPGPLSDEEFEEREARYLAGFPGAPKDAVRVLYRQVKGRKQAEPLPGGEVLPEVEE